MKKTLLFLLVWIFPLGASAGELERRQFAEEILRAQGLPEQIADLQTRFTTAALGEVEGLDLNDEQKALAREARSAVLAELAAKIDWGAIKEDIIGLYASEYSEAELRQIRDFLTSTAGRKYREKIPLVKDRINAIAREKMLTAMPGVLARVAKSMVEANQQ
jgi:hypothetical protein